MALFGQGKTNKCEIAVFVIILYLLIIQVLNTFMAGQWAEWMADNTFKAIATTLGWIGLIAGLILSIGMMANKFGCYDKFV